MIRFTTQKCLIPLLLLALVAVQSCVKENQTVEPSAGGDALITLTMRLPGNTTATRALKENDEMKVATIEVLVFDKASGEYLYTVYGNQVTQNQDKAEFTVRLIESEAPVDLWILANSRKWIGRSYGGEIPKDETLYKADIQKKITAVISGKWNTDPLSTNYGAIPMWGEVKNIMVNEALTQAGIKDIGMTRMLARIDVNIEDDAQNNFKLRTVRLYNYNTRGLVIPDTEDPAIWKEGKAEGASLPVDPGKADKPTPEDNVLLYDVMTFADIACAGEIYVFEAEAGSVENYLENICLVIGGEYYDTRYNEWSTYYYRADFAKIVNNTSNYIPVKRNHQYNVRVTKITGPGYSEPDDAFNSLPSNIEAGVLEWNQSDMDEMWFDGQYYYSVSPLNVEEWAPARTDNKIKVTTDYPTWSYELSDLPTPGDPAANPSNVNWLTVTSHKALQNYPGSGRTDYIEYDVVKNESGGNRTAYIHVTAGRVTMTVTIVQNLWFIDKISVSPANDIHSGGEVRRVIIEGLFDNTPVRAWDIINDQLIDSGTVGSNKDNPSNPGIAELVIPELWHPLDISRPNDITVAFEYYSSQHADWRLIRTEDQESYWLNITTDHVPGAEIPSEGESYTLKAWGYFPDIEFRFATLSNGVYTPVHSTTPVINSTRADESSPATAQITIYEAASSRMLYLQYSRDKDHNEWHTLSSGEQYKKNLVININNRDVIVANEYAWVSDTDSSREMDWATAVGIPVENNDIFHGESNHLIIQPTELTGCGAYWERSKDDPVSGQLKWRMSTFAEAWYGMNQPRYFEEDKVTVWATNTPPATDGGKQKGVSAYFIEFDKNGTYGAFNKTTKLYVRCVRNK